MAEPVLDIAAPRFAAGAFEPASKRDSDRFAGEVPPGEGGPDAFGYVFRTSLATDGPAFEWTDATGSGQVVALQGDDVTSAAMPIGFEFPFYGAPMTMLRICSNGWISFTSALASFSNTALPSAATRRGVIAAMTFVIALSANVSSASRIAAGVRR